MSCQNDALLLQVGLCAGAYWLGGIPLLVAWIIGGVVWRAVAQRRRDERMTRELFERMEWERLRAEAEARNRPPPPPGAIVLSNGAWLPPHERRELQIDEPSPPGGRDFLAHR